MYKTKAYSAASATSPLASNLAPLLCVVIVTPTPCPAQRLSPERFRMP
jgi:hypothetical protein